MMGRAAKMTIFLYIMSILALVQGVVALRNGSRNARYALCYKRPGPALALSTPGAESVTVFCPIKGGAADLEGNLRSLLRQDYPDYNVVFVVESRSDPAFDLVDSLSGGGRAKVVVAGLSRGRGQKVHNLATAVKSEGALPWAYVFCDADALFPDHWLRNLVAPLTESGVGATTGYRWYLSRSLDHQATGDGHVGGDLPLVDRIATFMRSAWNASVVGFLGPHANNFVWGGSTGIRRETFESARVPDFWSGAVSDDYALTRAIQAIDLEIVYVPTCLVPSADTCGPRGLIEFTNRQIRITRIYSPGVFRMGIVGYSVFNLTFLWLMARWLTTPWLGGGIESGLLPFLIWVTLYLLAAVQADGRVRAARGAIDDPSLERHRWLYVLAPPLVALLYQWNMVGALLGRDIVWKGIRYRMLGPNQTVVDRPDGR
jgi:ceramide glucosyltransferase